MSKFIINIDMDNAAFEYKEPEVIRILNKIIETIKDHDLPNRPTLTPIFDINGNKCGKVEIR